MVPPYEDEHRMQTGMPQFVLPRLTKVVRRIMIANVAVFVPFFLWWYTEGSIFGLTYFDAVRQLGMDSGRWVESFPLAPGWQILTYGFLHTPNTAWHLLGNMLMLYFFGTMLEERLGGRRFFLTYMAAQIVGALLFVVPAFFGMSGSLAIGASGAVFGVMIAAATLFPNQRVFIFFIPVKMKWLAIGIVGLEAFAALVDFKQGSDGIAHLVHLGGAAYGFLAVRFGLIQKDPIQILERKRAVMQVAREADDEVRMDRLLEKIHSEGMAALTRSEKEFLKRMSSRR
ncbi:MAG: rhomboid family intramembrane serine protease [Planctomycetes bacterium]|nr:rhomboid family intramembrane serine protease [Planctomycetota bacterium]